nr:uncharacterized protein LOC112738058 [Arachis hypogaea]
MHTNLRKGETGRKREEKGDGAGWGLAAVTVAVKREGWRGESLHPREKRCCLPSPSPSRPWTHKLALLPIRSQAVVDGTESRRERDTRREAHDQPCRRQRRGLPSPSSRAATASPLLSCSTAVVALCCCRVSPSRRWRRKARQFCFCLWVLESEKTPMPLLFVGFKIIAATGITNRKGEEAVFCCHWCCHRTVEAIADYDFVIWG